MTAQGEDILAWLDSAITRRQSAASVASPGPWVQGGIGDYGWTVRTGIRSVETEDSEIGQADARHIALNSPSTVLLRCAADRKLLELHSGRMHSCPATDETGYLDEWTHFGSAYACPVVHLLAEGYGWTGGER
jgi:hypothetical protein